MRFESHSTHFLLVKNNYYIVSVEICFMAKAFIPSFAYFLQLQILRTGDLVFLFLPLIKFLFILETN